MLYNIEQFSSYKIFIILISKANPEVLRQCIIELKTKNSEFEKHVEDILLCKSLQVEKITELNSKNVPL